MMRDETGDNRWKTEAAHSAGTGIQDCTAAQRETLQQGLRILARIIASAHLRQKARSDAPGPEP